MPFDPKKVDMKLLAKALGLVSDPSRDPIGFSHELRQSLSRLSMELDGDTTDMMPLGGGAPDDTADMVDQVENRAARRRAGVIANAEGGYGETDDPLPLPGDIGYHPGYRR